MSEPVPEQGQSEVPVWPKFILPVLTVLEDGSIVHRRDLIHRSIEAAGLS